MAFPLCGLSGSVKPYFGRPDRPASPRLATVSVPSPTPLAPVAPVPKSKGPSARQIVQQAMRDRNWSATITDTRCDVVVPVASERKQTVTVQWSDRDRRGRPLFVCSSFCGPAASKNALALLRLNARRHDLAFAAAKVDQAELIVLRGALRVDSASADDVADWVDAVASYADRVENKLVGTDTF